MAEETSEICVMVELISRIAVTVSAVTDCMSATWALISEVAFAVWVANALTSDATTANPRPASPARAASIVALSARRFVCSATSVISLTTSLMRPAARESFAMLWSVFCAWLTAAPAIRLDSVDLPADLVDRRGNFFGCGRDGLDILGDRA